MMGLGLKLRSGLGPVPGLRSVPSLGPVLGTLLSLTPCLWPGLDLGRGLGGSGPDLGLALDLGPDRGLAMDLGPLTRTGAGPSAGASYGAGVGSGASAQCRA